MKKALCFFGLIASLAFTGCATAPHQSADSLPPGIVQTPPSNLLIISATYGSGANFADVTDRVNDLLRQPRVEFFARPEWLNADPTPGWNKALVIVYEYKGHRHIFTTGEGGRVTAKLLTQTDGKKKKHTTSHDQG
jgi:hypothetical protein